VTDRPLWLEGRRFVAFGDPGVVECAFGSDSVGDVGGSGAPPRGHHEAPAIGCCCWCGWWWRVGGGAVPLGEENPATGVGGVGLAGRGGPDDGRVGQLLVGPAAGAGPECFEQVMFSAEAFEVVDKW